MLIQKTLLKHYKNERFVQINDLGEMPTISDVIGSNLCRIGILQHTKKNHVIITSVIDNLSIILSELLSLDKVKRISPLQPSAFICWAYILLYPKVSAIDINIPGSAFRLIEGKAGLSISEHWRSFKEK